MEGWQGAVLVVGLPWATGLGLALHRAGSAFREGDTGPSFTGSNDAGRRLFHAFLAHARFIHRWLAVAAISFSRFDWNRARILLRLWRGVGLARLSAAPTEAGWLALSTGAQRSCLGHLAFSIYHIDWLRTRGRGFVS